MFTEAGVQVEIGWTGNSLDESNSFNTCSCLSGEEGEGGVLACTDIAAVAYSMVEGGEQPIDAGAAAGRLGSGAGATICFSLAAMLYWI